MLCTRVWNCTDFYPRSPRGERLNAHGRTEPARVHFYPRSPRGERPTRLVLKVRTLVFLSTLPARGATKGGVYDCHRLRFLSTLPARGATKASAVQPGHSGISIHAPREGSDLALALCWAAVISFLSTLPARGATQPGIFTGGRNGNFYPRSPRGERPGLRCTMPTCPLLFLSTLPARGATLTAPSAVLSMSTFLSTLPARGATQCRAPGRRADSISIHAPREGSDPDL